MRLTIMEWLGWFSVVGLTATGLALAAFQGGRWLVDKWLSNKFAKELERFKADQVQEIERLKFQIGSLLDRTTKLHQAEFAILPEIWSKLTTAFVESRAFVSPLQMHPDLDRMKDDELDDFLAKSFLSDFQKREIKGEGKRTDYFINAEFHHRHRLCRIALRDFRVTYLHHSIFVSKELDEKINAVAAAIAAALDQHSFNRQYETKSLKRDGIELLLYKGEELIGAVREEIKTRFSDPVHRIKLGQ